MDVETTDIVRTDCDNIQVDRDQIEASVVKKNNMDKLKAKASSEDVHSTFQNKKKPNKNATSEKKVFKLRSIQGRLNI